MQAALLQLRPGVEESANRTEHDCHGDSFYVLLGATPHLNRVGSLLLPLRTALLMSPFCRTLRQ